MKAPIESNHTLAEIKENKSSSKLEDSENIGKSEVP